MSDGLDRASAYHQLSYFEGSARICEALRPDKVSGGVLRHLNALNRFYLDRERHPGLLPEFERVARTLQGGQHFCELALLNAQEGLWIRGSSPLGPTGRNFTLNQRSA